ncbi:DUF4097 family beta strand repeat-containing protein [Allonocardiopsis opalescens]|uniref:Putative adhesin n=1 Tax=Allonocardiopsis opalescens TaxID=1144618 RepID=A0A2T0QDR6_9ACTN|nr:DUF4097 family beta strand repeat-containing protein [Allonocardiopsis opalescens]PRY02069.1 putative adhesin [Allonocardiopsis opalescens]
MPRWTIEQPQTLDFDGIVTLTIRLVGGHVDVLTTKGGGTLEVSRLSGEPLLVSQQAGMLTITYDDLTRDGLLERVRQPQLAGFLGLKRRSATVSVAVPADCPVDITVASASVVVAGIQAKTSVTTASGSVTLDGVHGPLKANSLSGDIDAQGLAGGVSFHTLSGEISVAGGEVHKLTARTASGRITADVEPSADASVKFASVSGDIALRVPDGMAAAVDLRSTSGRIDAAFDGLDERRLPGQAQSTGTIGGTDAAAAIGLTTVSGDIALLRRAAGEPPLTPKRIR